jgi:transcriptional regulator with XRE-family HTH domain
MLVGHRGIEAEVHVATAEQRRRFGRALQRAREDCGLSQRGLADALGVSQASVSQWLLGQTAPRPERVAALERVLRMEPSSLARLLGQVPYDDRATPPSVSVTEAAEADPRLGTRERRILAAVYRELVHQRELDQAGSGLPADGEAASRA